MALKFLNDGYFAGKVGIGTESPDGNLEVITSTIVSGASDTVNNVLIGLQAANRPTIILDTADTTYTNRSWNITNVGSAGKLFIGRNGLDVMVMDNDGKVGIGAYSPGAKLDIHTPTNSNGLLIREDTDDSITHNLYIDSADNGVGVLYANGQSAKIQLNTAGDSYFVGGDVGIGTTSPSAKTHIIGDNDAWTLKVENTQALAYGLSVNTAGTATSTYNSAFYTHSGTGMFIVNNGNVGIGTSSPATKLSINDVLGISGTGNNTYGQIDLVNTQTGTSGDEIGPFITFRGKRGAVDTTIAAYGAIGAVNTGVTGNSTGALTFLVKNAIGAAQDLVEQMRITTGGNVGIGTTNPDAKLNVVGTGTQLGTSGYYYNTLLKDATNSGVLLGGNNTDNGAGFLAGINELAFLTFGTSWGERMRITGAGNVGIGTTSPDAKLMVSTDDQLIARFKSTNTGTTGIRIQGVDTSATDAVFVDWVYDAENRKYGFGEGTSSGELPISSGLSHCDIVFDDGNVGIGTTSPGARLHVDGTVIFDTDTGSQPFYVTRNGSSSQSLKIYTDDVASYFTTIQDETTGTYGSMIFSLDNGAPSPVYSFNYGSSALVRIQANGNVGIGTTSPGSKLHVQSSGLGDTGGIRITNSGAGGDDYRIWPTATANGEGAGKLIFTNNGGNRLTLDGSGNVGIGTTDPTYKLEVASTGDGLLSLKGATKPVMRFMVGTSTVGTIQAQENTSLNVSAYGTSSLNLQTAGTAPRLTILTGGNVGIGTTNPSATLHLSSASPYIYLDDTSTTGTLTRFQIINGDVGTTQSTSFGFNNTSGTATLDVLTINEAGNVGIGTTSPGSLLEIEGATNSSTSNLLRLSRATQGSTPEKVAGFYSGTSGEKGYITVNNFGTAYNTSSDYRLKENIKPIDNSVERLMSLKPCNFNFISEDEDKVVMDGFIAHEAKEVVPEAVTGVKDAVDEKGNPAYQGIDQSKLVPLLTAALQEALQRIEILEQKINN